MKTMLKLATWEQRPIMMRLMQFYLYDFTEFIEIDLSADGTFPDYPDLDQYWTSGDRKMAFIMWYKGKPAGFALVDRLDDKLEGDYYMAEFFVMRPFRRYGIGSWAARELFSRLRGKWKVTQVKNNAPARAFWRKVIGEYTGGNFTEKIHPWKGSPSQYFST